MCSSPPIVFIAHLLLFSLFFHLPTLSPISCEGGIFRIPAEIIDLNAWGFLCLYSLSVLMKLLSFLLTPFSHQPFLHPLYSEPINSLSHTLFYQFYALSPISFEGRIFRTPAAILMLIIDFNALRFIGPSSLSLLLKLLTHLLPPFSHRLFLHCLYSSPPLLFRTHNLPFSLFYQLLVVFPISCEG